MRTQHGIGNLRCKVLGVSSLIGILSIVGCGSTYSGGASTTSSGAAVVADYYNNRVLFYNLPLTTGQSANIVLGQTNFTSATYGTTASTMGGPSGVAADKAGNIYVTEDGNCRVTQFRPPFANGMSATLVFGQSTATCPFIVSNTTLGNMGPQSLQVYRFGNLQVSGASLDSNGDLWVSDTGANRIVEYVPPFSDVNGAPAASLALGQQTSIPAS